MSEAPFPEPQAPEGLPPLIRVAEAKRANDALVRAAQLRESYGINFYRPHWKQHIFHTNEKVARYLRTGNRFGKSECGIVEDLSFCLGQRPFYKKAFDVKDGEGVVRYQHPGGDQHEYVTKGIPSRPVKGLILVVDWEMAKRIFTNREGSADTIGKLWKFLPYESIGKITNGGRGDRIVQVEIKRHRDVGGGSSTLTFDTVESYRHNKMGGESADWDFIHVDEPVPEPMFKAFARGLMDRRGKNWFTCTPLDEMWINDKFTPPGNRMLHNAPDGVSFEDRFIITGSVYDNPHRNVEGVQDFERSLTREEKQCRLFGLPLAMAGSVYKEFIYDMHVLADLPVDSNGQPWKEFWLPPLDYTVRVAWDVHGARLPQAILFAATAPSGDVFIYDELFNEPLITPTAKAVMRKLEGRNVISRIIDPRALIVNPVTQTADVLEAIADEGLYFDPASKDLTTGISAVKEKLEERHVVTQLPTIYFSPKLTQTLWEFSHYVYDLKKNEPKDQDNHQMENLYRLVLNGLDYVSPISDKEYNSRRRPTVVGPHEHRRGFRAPRNLHLS